MSTSRPLRAFFGHHKCASSWIELIVQEVCRELKLRFAVVYDPSMFSHDLARFVADNRVDVLAYSNADYRYVEPLANFRGFHVVRDPRDVCVSAYFSHLHSHPTSAWPELIGHRERLRRESKEQGLFTEMDSRRTQFEEMRSWREPNDRILEISMERLTADPYQQMLAIVEFLELVDPSDFTPAKRARHFVSKLCRRIEHTTGRSTLIPWKLKALPAERFLGIVWERDFKKKAGGRAQGQEDPKSHYRKGTPGDWQNHFTLAHVAYFKQRYGDLLFQYGYESDPDWDARFGAPQHMVETENLQTR